MKIFFPSSYPLLFLLVSGILLAGCPAATNPAHSNGPVDTDWLDKLPACPCESPDKNGIRLNDGWAKDKGDLDKYHKGASESYRSYPAIETSEGSSGQQCCYDKNGQLITGGRAAGTPDKENTCDGEDAEGVMKIKLTRLLSHYYKDVKPWEAYGGKDSGWIGYNKIWKPNNGNKCPANTIE
jgi:hypothetical protein